MSKELEKAMLRIKRSIEQKASKDMKPMLKAYQDSLERIQGKTTQLVNKHIRDGVLSLNDAERYVMLRELEQQIIEQARDIGRLELTSTTDILKDSYTTSYYRTFYEIDRGVNVGTSFSLLRPEFVESAVSLPLEGMMFSDRIWTNKESMINRLRGGLQRTLIDGEDPKKIAREISRAYGTSAYESTRLVQTEVARATTQASQQVYERSGVVAQIMYNATLDGKTSEECEELDGKVFARGSEPSVPQHPSCRCVLTPMIEGWSPTRRKDNITKEVIPYQNYTDWAKDKGIK